MFRCIRCGIEKSEDNFSPNRWTERGHQPYCKGCASQYAKEWRKKNPEKSHARGVRKYASWRLKHPPVIKEKRTTPEGRLCSTCGKRKPEFEFGKLSSSTDGFAFRCKSCARNAAMRSRYSDIELSRAKERAKAKKLYKRDRDKILKNRKHERMKYRYGISLNLRDEILEHQGSVCAICSNPIRFRTDENSKGDANIDHDHISGAVRGILCSRCNTGLGAFKDDILILDRAISYLRSHSS